MRLRTVIYTAFTLPLCLASCSVTKYVPEGKLLLDKVTVKADGTAAGINAGRYRQYVAQKGNSRWFSAFKMPLATYSLSGRDSSKWTNRTLKSMGEAPVVFDSLSTMRSCQDLANELRNEGWLRATADAAIRLKSRRRVDVEYTIHPGKPYHIGEAAYEIGDTGVDSLLQESGFTPGLRRGMRFTVEALEKERTRITALLNDNGYYGFNKDFITFEADTARGDRSVGLLLCLHPYGEEGGVKTPHTRYRIGGVTHTNQADTAARVGLRHKTLMENTFIRPGGYYSNAALRSTYSHFGRLQAVKYTNVSFTKAPGDSTLDCNIQLSTNKPHTISFQPEGTNTAGDLGAAATLAYQNRNLFGGSEALSIELRGAYEAITGLEGYNNDNFEEYSVQAGLTFPRFIAPFLSQEFRRRINATSEVSLLYDLQNRPEYHRRVLSVAWRYKWNNPDRRSRYQIDLLDLNYVFMPWISETFRSDYLEDVTSRNAILRYNYEDLFILKLGFRYAYSNDTYAIKMNAETAGNVLDTGARLLNTQADGQGRRTLFNIAYAQYAKADLEYTRNIKLDYDNTLVLHAGLGIAYPYGNSTVLPFEKRYFSGGANSVRGWSVRGLGPGKYSGRDGRIDFINQTGDLKLDLNVEYRAKLFWKLNGAAFVDAGNIWTLRSYSDQPGGQFRIDSFLSQIAVGYGLGLRLNFDYFIMRFDFGMKAVNPAYDDERDHWPLIHPRLGRDLTFHFAVGLPF